MRSRDAGVAPTRAGYDACLMMHHSLHRRDLLRRMNAHPLIAARRDPHRNVARRASLTINDNHLLLEATWSTQSARNHPAESLVASDADDFLTRMGVSIQPDQQTKSTLLFEL